MRQVALVALAAAAIGCRAVADSGATYRACDRGHYSEHFAPGTTEKNLLERCWFFDNVQDVDDLFFEDDDLVIRVDDDGAAWSASEQGPFAYRRLPKDFVVATRVEVLNLSDGKHCLDATDAVGIVMRQDAGWTGLFITLFTPDPAPPGLDCESESAEAVPPVKGMVRRQDDAGPLVETTGTDEKGIGLDAEADVAVCRLNGVLTTYYRDLSVDDPSWIEIGEGLAVGDGAADVGLTASGVTAEAHFQWVEFADRVGADGCVGALERFQVPTLE